MALVKSTNVSFAYATNKLNTIDEDCFINKLPTSSQNACSAAYSNRLVRAVYDGPVVQVRRGSDNALQDFFGDSAGNLTTRPFGTGQSLHAWLNGAIGYVARLYDQSGFEKHLSNPYIAPNTTFPVAGLTGAVTNVSAAVGGGVYIVTSSGNDAETPVNAFDSSLSTASRSAEPVYDGLTGVYAGNVTTTSDVGTVYSGEWIQLQLPASIRLTSFILTSRSDLADSRSPRSFVLLGSTTGERWTLVHEETNLNNWTNSQTRTFIVTTNPGVYKYYRLVVRRVGNYDNSSYQPGFSLSDFKLIGGNTDTQPTIGTGIFPPMPMTANTTSVNDSTLTYGSGSYVASASSAIHPTNHPAWRAFAQEESLDYGWASADNTYTSSTGQYAGSVTTIAGATTYSGEWIQLQLPQRIQLTSFAILPRLAIELAKEKSPRSFVILGSNNGSNWVLLHEQTNVNDWTKAYKTFNVTPSSTAYSYFRMVVRRVGNFDSSTGQLYGQTYVHMYVWKIFGNVESCTDIVYNGSTNFLTTDYGIQTYPPQALTANTTAFTTAEFGNGTYVASASTEYGVGNESWRAFNYQHTSDDVWHSDLTYNPTTGQYSGSITTTSLTNQVYRGEWLQIQLPTAIALTHFTIVPRTAGTGELYRSPRSFVVLGSNNGTSWTLVHEETNIASWFDANKVFFIRQATSSYSYYRIVIRRVGNFDTDGTAQQNSAQIASWFLHSSKLPVMMDPVERRLDVTMTSNSTTISGLTYVASASSVLDGTTFPAWRALDFDDNTFWHDVGNVYNTSTGVYTGSTRTRSANGTSYLGEWLQIQLPFPCILNWFYLVGRNGLITKRSPRSFVVLGSNDASNWNLIHEETNVNDWTGGLRLFNVDATIKPASYVYFRLVIRRVGNFDTDAANEQGTANLATWLLYGFRGAQKTTVFSDFKPYVTTANDVFGQHPNTLVNNGSYGLFMSNAFVYYHGYYNDGGISYNMVNYRRKLVMDLDNTLSSNNVVMCDNGSFFAGTSGLPSGHSVGFHSFDVGARNVSNNYYFNGVINEVIFFNESLQQTDILVYYQPTNKKVITNYLNKPKTTVRGVLGLPIASQADGNATRYYIPTNWKFAIDTQHLGNVITGTPLNMWRTATAVNFPVYYNSGGHQDMPYVNFAGTSSQHLNAGSVTLNVNSGGGFTAVAFVKFTGTANWERIFDFGNGENNDNIIFARPGVNTSIFFSMRNGATSYGLESPAGVIVQNEWAVFSCRYTASTRLAEIYKNGTLIASTTFAAAINDRTTTSNFVGRSNWVADAYSNMHLAGLYIYDRSLSTAEMGAIGNHLIMPVRKTISSLQDLSVVKANRTVLPMGRQLGEPSMFFDGSDLNYVMVDDVPKTPFSFSFWFNAQTDKIANWIVGLGSYTRTRDPSAIEIRYTAATTITVYAALPTAWSTVTFTAARDTWHHMTITVSANNVLNAYLNGGGKQTITGSGALPFASRFYLGSSGNVASGYGLTGYIQDFRVFDYVLRDDEIDNTRFSYGMRYFDYPILNSISSETSKYLVNRSNWYQKMTYSRQVGEFATSTSVTSILDPNAEVQLTNNTNWITNSYSQNFRIQDYRSFICRFEIWNSSAVADGMYFFCGAQTLPTQENLPAGGYNVNFQVLNFGTGPRGVSIYDSLDNRVASVPWTYWINSGTDATVANGTHMWMPVTIIYTQGAKNTWVVMMGEREVLTYSDANNENWLTTSGNLWGIGARTGGAAMSSWIRGVELVYTEPRYQVPTYPNTYYTKNIVQSGLVAHFDPGIPACYPGSGATMTSLVGNVTGTLGGSYSYNSNGTIRLTNTNAAASNVSYLQLTSISNITTVSIWYYQHSNLQMGYLLDMRTGGGGGWIISSLENADQGSNWINGILYKNGGSAQSIGRSNIETVGVWQNITVVANTAATDDMTLFARFSQNEGLDVTFGPIFVYNRAITEAENDANYNAVIKTLPLFNQVPRNPLSLGSAIAGGQLVSYPNGHLYNNDIVQSGLVAYFDPANSACYAGSNGITGAMLRSLVGNVTGTLGGTYSYSNGTIRLTNTSATEASNTSRLDLTSISNIRTVSLWYYQHSAPTIRFLLDARTADTGDGYIYSPGNGSTWTGGTLYKNGGNAQSLTWANIESVGVWQNVTVIASTSITNPMTLFGYFRGNHGLDVTFGPILIYNRAITQAENLQNYNAIFGNIGSPYNASSSSVLGGGGLPQFNPGKLFDKSNSTAFVSGVVYNGVTGMYSGGNSTTAANGTVYSGEWVQTRLNNSIRLRSYTITPRVNLAQNFIENPQFSTTTTLAANFKSSYYWNSNSGWSSSTSSQISGYPADKALNKTNVDHTDCWHSNFSTISASTPQWIQIKYPEPVSISTYTITSRVADGNGSVFFPTIWRLQGSNDGSTWVDLEANRSETTWSSNTTKSYTPRFKTAYTYFRLRIEGSRRLNGNTADDNQYVAIGEWRLYTDLLTSLYRSPRSFVVLGSNDGSSWNLIDERTGITDWLYGPKTFDVQRTIQSYNSYRLVTREVGNTTNSPYDWGTNTLDIANWELNAFPNTATIAPAINEYPPIALSSTSASVSSQNYGNGLYISSASSVLNAGTPANNAFNKSNVNNGDCWHSNGTTISASTPQWVQIQVPQPISVSSYSITSRLESTYINYPSLWRLQGSNDGTNWTNLESNRTMSSWGVNETKTFSNNINTNNLSFLYFRLLVEGSSRNGTGVEDNTWVAIGEWRLYGNERSTALTGTKYPTAPLNTEYPRANLSFRQTIWVPNSTTSTTYTYTGLGSPPDGTYNFWFRRGDLNMVWRLAGSLTISNGQFTNVLVATDNGAINFTSASGTNFVINPNSQIYADNYTMNLEPEEEYPPSILTAASTTLSSQTYGNGAYIVSASSTLSGEGSAVSSWKAFNKTNATDIDCWHSTNQSGSISASTPQWIQIQLPRPITLTSYSITARKSVDGNNVWYPRVWRLQGSNNGSTWVDLESNRTDDWWDNETKRYIPTSNTTTYSYFRLRVESSRYKRNDTSNDNSYVAIGELRLYTVGSILIARNTYGNGRYSVSASSNYYDYGYKESPWTIFNQTGPWATQFGSYNTANGNYQGTFSTTVQGTAYTGEWVQIELPTSIKLDRYDMQGGWAARNPKDFYMVGSNDGSNWTLLDTETNITGWTEWSGRRTFYTSNKSQAFTTFRLIVNKTNNDSNAGLNALKLYAVPEVLGNSLGNGVHTITSSSELNTITSGQNYPMNVFDDPSNITYDSTRTFFHSVQAYNTTTGAYTGSTTTLIDGNAYAGEWLQIQLPSSIALTSYSLTVRSDAPTSQGPNTWRIAGSNDGTTWTLVDEEINVNTWSGTNLTQTFTTISSRRFSYFRMICNVTGHTPAANRGAFVLVDWSLYDQSTRISSIVGNTARGFVDGLTWKFANGYHNESATYFDTTPYTQIGRSSDFTNLSTATNGRFTTAQTINSFSLEFTGYFRAPETGTYTFFANSDDEFYLWIGSSALSGYTTGNALLTDASGAVSSYGTISLIAGTYYPIRMLWAEGAGLQYVMFGFTTPSGVTVTDGSGYFFSSVGTNAAYPAESAKIIKSLTGTNTDGVYYINCNGVSEPTYCLMNDKYDGGGWMMLMKATRGNTFGFNANYWTTANTLNATDVTRSDADAKYNAFNYKPIKDILAIWPDISPSAYTNNFGNQGGSFFVEDGWVWEITNWNGASLTTALAGFQTARTVSPSAPAEFNGFASIWSTQTPTAHHVLGGATHLSHVGGGVVRWGFVFSDTNDYATGSDCWCGIGMGFGYASAGDYNNGPGVWILNSGINRTARVEMFGR